MEGWNHFEEEWLFRYSGVLGKSFQCFGMGTTTWLGFCILDYIIWRLTYWNGPEKLVPPIGIGLLPHLFSPLNSRILSFFPSTFASKPPIYKAGTAGVPGAECPHGLSGSGRGEGAGRGRRWASWRIWCAEDDGEGICVPFIPWRRMKLAFGLEPECWLNCPSFLSPSALTAFGSTKLFGAVTLININLASVK